jgi:predicted PolB exonuclease-like 3'-5' exonuclease
MGTTLVFDIETVPDAAGLRSVWGLVGDDAAVVEAALARRREQTGGASDFLPLHLHRVIVVSMLFRDADGIRIHSLHGGPDDEGRLIQGFFRTLARHTPTLVSWNGSGFDLQVLHYRGLINKVQAPRYWEQGEDDRDFRYNNYISRYHSRHTDLMDLLALHNGRANAPLDQLARLCGFPGKLGMDGSQVWPAWQAGRQDEIRDYCETDVANTWLLWCRFQLMRGTLDASAYDDEIALTRSTLAGLPGRHWQEFVAAWPT